MAITSDPGLDHQAAQALVRLCAGVLPVVIEMMQAFADIGPHIHKAERQSLQITQALSQSDGGVTGLASACDQAMAPYCKAASYLLVPRRPSPTYSKWFMRPFRR